MLSVGEPCHELLGLFLVGAQLEGGNELAAGHGGLDLALGVAYGHPLKVLDVFAVAVDVPAAADMGPAMPAWNSSLAFSLPIHTDLGISSSSCMRLNELNHKYFVQ